MRLSKEYEPINKEACMIIQDVIDFLNTDASWVNTNQSRDFLMFGDASTPITGIGVCWVVTLPVIKQAAAQGLNFIITHENLFYTETTVMKKELREARINKQKLLTQHGISVYRCHDVWDRIPQVGITDSWSALVDLPFKPRETTSFISVAFFDALTAQEVALKIASAIKPFGQDSVTLLGNPEQLVKSCALGTGAATDIFAMIRQGAECVVVSDDGKTNWVEGQYCVDYQIPMIIVHHPTCEVPGMMNLVTTLKKQFKNENIVYCHEGFEFTTISSL